MAGLSHLYDWYPGRESGTGISNLGSEGGESEKWKSTKITWGDMEEILKLQDKEMGQRYENIVSKQDQKMKKWIKEIEEKQNRIQLTIDDNKISVIESLGIFVALFTFISIEFQVFKIYSHPNSIVGISLVFLGSLLILISALDFLLNFKNIEGDNKKNTILKSIKLKIAFCWLLFIAIGIILLYTSPEKSNLEEKLLKIDNNLNCEQKIGDLTNMINDMEKQQNIEEKIVNYDNSILQCLKNKEYFSIKCF